MKQIILTQGKVALVDDDVYEWAKNYNWYTKNSRGVFYAARNVTFSLVPIKKRGTTFLHDAIMGFPLDNNEVDHIDGNGLNNQRYNLRIINHRNNMQNQILHRKGRLVGCSFRKDCSKWSAAIRIKGKAKHLGLFDTELEAHETYIKELSLLREAGLLK